MHTQPDAARYQLSSWCLAALVLLLVLQFSLLSALLAGCLVHTAILAVPKIRWVGTKGPAGKLVALGLLILILGTLLSGAALGIAALVGEGYLSLVVLLQKMADVLETARTHFPTWMQSYLPASADELESTVSQWLREHAGSLRRAGGNLGRTALHTLVGMIIGGLIALTPPAPEGASGPLTRAIYDRARIFACAFRRIAVAQVRISAINTAFTAVYLLIILPLLGIHLPLVKTMVAVTFLAGLMPLIGNLISNTVIVIVSLNDSLATAIGSLLFLVVIHKLEYLLNARIIGTQIRARTWELLLAMLSMEACFGMSGLIAAPIYYAYVKDELSARGAI